MLELGFVPTLDPRSPYGFDIEATVPKERWLRHQQQHLDHRLLQDLFHHTVVDLQAEFPGLGETVAFDVTHIYAWVKQNNLRDYVSERFNPALQPSGAPDCRLGVKRSTNQPAPQDSTKHKLAEQPAPPQPKQDQKPPQQRPPTPERKQTKKKKEKKGGRGQMR